MPLASTSKVTSICGTPIGRGGISTNSNLPRDLLSEAISLSPCRTCMETIVWLSSAVENISPLFTGIVVFLGINLVNTPPLVSRPIEMGTTSRSITSFISPFNTPPWMAAPMATTSSGFSPLFGGCKNISSTFFCTRGILVMPPTRTTSSISSASSPASARAMWQGIVSLSIRLPTIFSIWSLLIFFLRCFGPELSAAMNGRWISVSKTDDNSHFAFSDASLSRWSAILSWVKSTPCSFKNSPTRKSIAFWSKSSPPKKVSPFVALTSKTPSFSSRIDISNVPPPRSNTAILPLLFLSRP